MEAEISYGNAHKHTQKEMALRHTTKTVLITKELLKVSQSHISSCTTEL